MKRAWPQRAPSPTPSSASTTSLRSASTRTSAASDRSRRQRRHGPQVALDKLAVGSTLQGTVKGVTAFGAFVDVGAAVDGLLHASQLRDGPRAAFVHDARDVCKVGDRLEVVVVAVDLQAKKLSLGRPPSTEPPTPTTTAPSSVASTRPSTPSAAPSPRPPPMPAVDVATLLRKACADGELLQGTVRSVVSFGVFVTLAERPTRVEGLLHNSQMRLGPDGPPAVGERLGVYVVRVDEARQQVGLSTIPPSTVRREAHPPPAAPARKEVREAFPTLPGQAPPPQQDPPPQQEEERPLAAAIAAGLAAVPISKVVSDEVLSERTFRRMPGGRLRTLRLVRKRWRDELPYESYDNDDLDQEACDV